MPLELIVGRANTGKTGAAYDAIRNALKDGQMPVLVVPSLPDLERARHDFSREPSLGLTIRTFDQFVGELWAERGDGRTIIAPATKSLLLMAALRAAGLDGGYRRAATVLIDSLSDQTGTGWRERIPTRAGKLESALTRYVAELEGRGLLGEAEAARTLAASGDLPSSPVVFNRFDDFTTSQVALVKALAQRSSVSVTLTWDEGFAPTAALDALVAELAADTVTRLSTGPYNTPDELRKVSDALFGAALTLEPAGPVIMGAAEGESAQANLVVDAVEEALRDGVPSDRIVVALRSPNRHYRHLRRALADAAIEADFDVDLKLVDTAFGSAVTEALAAALHTDANAAMAALRTPYSGLDAEAARRLEARVRRAGLDSAFGGTALHQGVLGVMTKEVVQLQRGTGSWGRLSEAVDSMYSQAWRGRLDTEGQQTLDARALREIHAAFEAAEAAGRDSDMADVLAMLQEATIHTGGRGGAGVRVLPVTRLRGLRFDTVVVAGLNSGEFPAVPDETGLPGSRMHELVTDMGGSGVRRHGEEFEDLLFYETITRATRRVVLIGQIADDDGEDTALSALWEQIADFYAPARETLEDIPGLRYRALALAPNAEGRGREPLQAMARAKDTGDERVAAAVRRASGRPARLSLAASGLEILSASQIETYLSCPYRWFFDRAVGATELETAFDAKQEGSLAHALLKATYDAMLTAGHKSITPMNLPEALRRLDEAVTEQAVGARYDGLAARVGTQMARRWAARILEQDAEDASGFVPWAFEYAFGLENDPVDFGVFGLRGMVDRIDTDSRGHALVTDYKRSAKSGLNGEALIERRAIQVLLYMEAVERSTDLTPVAGVYRGLKQDRMTGVVDQATDAAPLLDRKKAGVDADTLAELRKAAVTLSAEAVEGMRAGQIRPAPINKDACAFCGARAVCGEAL
ncbi:MAG TPA: PD-(D/E)XK nuclease family protein [Coriobacteriia bacterium]|nr:PD-(D/E)XK nuclease family protein [Coriobacteriia bacterium]